MPSEVSVDTVQSLVSCLESLRRKSPIRAKHAYADTSAGRVWIRTLRGSLSKLKTAKVENACDANKVLPSLLACRM